MGLSLCKYCCWTKRNRVIHSNNRNFNILLLGLENVGKTEIACILAGKTRTHYEPTNGVQCCQVDYPNYALIITEIGGNREMQKLWHHYYAKTMGLIFCYDMSAPLQEMQKSFQILNKISSHSFLRGKPVLLVGTKSDLVSDTIQLYDIENTFALEALANRYFSSLKSIHFSPSDMNNLWIGIDWLAGCMEVNYKRLIGRIKYDAARESIQKKRDSRRKRFTISYRRPKTAPADLGLEYANGTPSVLSAAGQYAFRLANKSIQQNSDETRTTSDIS